MSKTVKGCLFRALRLALIVTLPVIAIAQQQPQKTVSNIQVEVIYLERGGGCQPAQITRPQGQQFRLLVVNKSGNQNVQLSLQGVGAQIAQAAKQFTPTDTHWLQLLNLTAGTYTLTAPSSQPFGCTIVLK